MKTADLPDIAGSYAAIQMFRPVDLGLRLEYLRARGKALAYGGEHAIEARELYGRVCGSLRAGRTANNG